MLRITLVLTVAAVVFGQSPPVAYTGARIIPIAGAEIPNGVLVVHHGKIVAVGPASSTAVPRGARREDVSGKVIMPGLVDSHSHIGGIDGGDSSAALHPDVRVLDSINARDTRIQKAQAGGITTANVMPGSGLLLSGQTLYIKLRDAKTVDELLIRNSSGTPAGGMKMANGTNPRGASPQPGTRAKSAALVREQFIKAQEYREKMRTVTDPEKKPARDLKMEGLVEVLEGKRTVHHHTHRHDDILTALRLAREFGYRVVLHHVSDGWAVAGEIAAAKAACSIILIDSPGGKIEAKDNNYRTAAVLDRAGVLTGFHTDDPITDSRLFFRQAGLAVRGGMSREKALYGLTMANAIMLDLQDRVGSLETGKDADFIVLSGDPLSVYTKVLSTWVDGVKVFDRADPKDRLYAEGGYGAGEGQDLSLHILEEEEQ